MIQHRGIAPPKATLVFLLALLTAAAAAGCAESSGSEGGHSNGDFEIRAMIAADRQQMQSMDERLRRLEGQIQDLAHTPPAPAETNIPPPRQQPPPAAGAP